MLNRITKLTIKQLIKNNMNLFNVYPLYNITPVKAFDCIITDKTILNISIYMEGMV